MSFGRAPRGAVAYGAWDGSLMSIDSKKLTVIMIFSYLSMKRYILRGIPCSKIMGMLGYGNFDFACKFLEKGMRKVTNIFL